MPQNETTETPLWLREAAAAIDDLARDDSSSPHVRAQLEQSKLGTLAAQASHRLATLRLRNLQETLSDVEGIIDGLRQEVRRRREENRSLKLTEEMLAEAERERARLLQAASTSIRVPGYIAGERHFFNSESSESDRGPDAKVAISRHFSSFYRDFVDEPSRSDLDEWHDHFYAVEPSHIDPYLEETAAQLEPEIQQIIEAKEKSQELPPRRPAAPAKPKPALNFSLSRPKSEAPKKPEASQASKSFSLGASRTSAQPKVSKPAVKPLGFLSKTSPAASPKVTKSPSVFKLASAAPKPTPAERRIRQAEVAETEQLEDLELAALEDQLAALPELDFESDLDGELSLDGLEVDDFDLDTLNFDELDLGDEVSLDDELTLEDLDGIEATLEDDLLLAPSETELELVDPSEVDEDGELDELDFEDIELEDLAIDESLGLEDLALDEELLLQEDDLQDLELDLDELEELAELDEVPSDEPVAEVAPISLEPEVVLESEVAPVEPEADPLSDLEEINDAELDFDSMGLEDIDLSDFELDDLDLDSLELDSDEIQQALDAAQPTAKPVEVQEPVIEAVEPVEIQEPVIEAVEPVEIQEPVIEAVEPVEVQEPVIEAVEPVEIQEPVIEAVEPVEIQEPVIEAVEPVEIQEPVIEAVEPVEIQEPVIEAVEPVEVQEPVEEFDILSVQELDADDFDLPSIEDLETPELDLDMLDLEEPVIEALEPEVIEEPVIEALEPEVIEEPVIEALEPEVIEEPVIEALEPEVIEEPVIEALEPEVIEEPVIEALEPEVIEEPVIEALEPEVIEEPVIEALEPELVEEPVIEALEPEVIEEPVIEALEPEVIEEPVIEALEPEVTEEPVIEALEPEVTEEPVIEALEPEVTEEPVIEALEPEVIEEPVIEALEPEVIEEPVIEALEPEVTEEPVIEALEPEVIEEPVIEALEPEVIEEPVIEALEPEVIEEPVIEALEPEIIEEPVIEALEPELIEEPVIDLLEPSFEEPLIESLEPSVELPALEIGAEQDLFEGAANALAPIDDLFGGAAPSLDDLLGPADLPSADLVSAQVSDDLFATSGTSSELIDTPDWLLEPLAELVPPTEAEAPTVVAAAEVVEAPVVAEAPAKVEPAKPAYETGAVERRRLVRLSCDYAGSMYYEGRPIEGRIMDISLGGMKIRVNPGPKAGQDVTVGNPMPDARTSDPVKAKIAWVRDARTGDGKVDVGLQFSEAPESLGRSWIIQVINKIGTQTRQINQRKYTRAIANLPVDIEINREKLKGTALDLGLGGALVATSRPFTPTTRFQMSVGPFGNHDVLDVRSEVVQSRHDEEKAEWQQSVKFIEMGPSQTKLLGKYVVDLLKSSGTVPNQG